MKFAVSGEDVEKQNLTYTLGAACSECVVERAAAKPATPPPPPVCPEPHRDLYTSVHSSMVTTGRR